MKAAMPVAGAARIVRGIDIAVSSKPDVLFQRFGRLGPMRSATCREAIAGRRQQSIGVNRHAGCIGSPY
jgi:hypothetical protein